jgi:hypothetical protein
MDIVPAVLREDVAHMTSGFSLSSASMERVQRVIAFLQEASESSKLITRQRAAGAGAANPDYDHEFSSSGGVGGILERQRRVSDGIEMLAAIELEKVLHFWEALSGLVHLVQAYALPDGVWSEDRNEREMVMALGRMDETAVWHAFWETEYLAEVEHAPEYVVVAEKLANILPFTRAEGGRDACRQAYDSWRHEAQALPLL